MSNREELLTPVGRLVQGSLYEGQTTDAENRPLIYKTGPNAGQPRLDYYFALAIAKGSETHWSQTPWGKKIWDVAHVGFPNGQTKSPTFAWKVIDGDSTIVNKVGKRPCDREGYPGHWVLNFSSGFAPSIYNADGTKQILEPNAVKLGDYIQVYGTVVDNESQQQPGVFLNHSMVAFAGHGTRIIIGADPKNVGFGQSPLPPGASPIPLSQGFNPAPMPAPAAPTPPPPPIVPHTAILTPPLRKMTALAQGATYEQLIAIGWTDETLIQFKMMEA